MVKSTRIMLTKLSVVAIIIIILFAPAFMMGCVREVVRYEPYPLPIPPKSLLPTASRKELACLSDEAYKKMDQREETIIHDYNVCKGLICSTRPDGCPEE